MNYQENLLGYDEVVDTLADSITVYRKISTPLRDGFQFPDLLSLYDAYPHLREMYDDRRTFAAQFIDLTAEETIAVFDELAIRTGVPRDKVEQALSAPSASPAVPTALCATTWLRSRTFGKKPASSSGWKMGRALGC